MPLSFITGNPGKFREAQAIIPDLRQLDIDLPEIQDIDAKRIIAAKLSAAFKYRGSGGNDHAADQDEFIVEDISLYLDCLHGLPGPLIKWFMKTIGNTGLAEITEKFDNNRAQAKIIIGYAKGKDDVKFFESTMTGTIVAPRGENGFGWDPIFQPDSATKTFAEMTVAEKNAISMRRLALEKLKKSRI